MRDFDDSNLKLPHSLGDAVNEMYRQMWFITEPIRLRWNDVEIIMRKVVDPPNSRHEK